MPFVASTISSDYGEIGSIVLNMSDVSGIPGELSRTMTDEMLEQTYQTPFGKFTIKVVSGSIYQELERPDRRIVVEETPDYTIWMLVNQDYKLLINRTGTRILEEFTCPDGYRKAVREMGNVNEKVRGDTEKYPEAKEMLETELNRMETIKQQYMELPGTENVTSGEKIAVNELLPNPNGTQDYNGDGNFTDSGDEFIEIYNYGDVEIDMTGWTIKDGNTIEMIDGTVIGPGEYMYFVSGDKSGDYGKEWDGSWPSLTNGGDEIRIYNDRDVVVDEFVYTSSTEGKSWSRVPDGTGSTEEKEPTPGESND